MIHSSMYNETFCLRLALATQFFEFTSESSQITAKVAAASLSKHQGTQVSKRVHSISQNSFKFLVPRHDLHTEHGQDIYHYLEWGSTHFTRYPDMASGLNVEVLVMLSA